MLYFVRYLLIGLLLVTIISCSTAVKEEPAAKPTPLVDLKADQETFFLKKLWSSRAVTGVGKKSYQLILACSTNNIFVAGINGHIRALRKSDGKTVWERSLGSVTVGGGVGVGNGVVALGTLDGQVFALSEADGVVVWKKRVSGEVLCAPTVANGMVIVKTIDGGLAAFSVVNGKELWKQVVTPPSLILREAGEVLIEKGVVVAGFSNGEVRGYRLKDGNLMWVAQVSKLTTGNELEQMIDIVGKPILSGEEIFVSGYQGNTAAINFNTGRILWRQSISSYRTVAEGFGLVYVVGQDGLVQALKRTSGDLSWQQEQLKMRDLSAPKIFEDVVVIGDYKGYLHCLSQINGSIIGRIRLGSSPIREQPVVDNEILYIMNTAGEVFALSSRHNGI